MMNCRCMVLQAVKKSHKGKNPGDYLKFTDESDPLQAGLEIYASPPGKKLQNLSLLSGGEQALTALSVLFAVFLSNPAPICVLDEVDAPLDDTNVDRFCTLVEDISKSSLVIKPIRSIVELSNIFTKTACLNPFLLPTKVPIKSFTDEYIVFKRGALSKRLLKNLFIGLEIIMLPK